MFTSEITKTQSPPKVALVWLAGLMALNILLHFPYITHGFGEADAARLALDALHQSQFGEPYSNDYWLRSSPLYILSSAEILKSGGFNPAHLPYAWSLLSLASGTAALVLLFYFVWGLSTHVTPAFLAVMLLMITPSFWYLSNYGFPTLTALMFFLAASLSYFHALKARNRSLFFVSAALFMFAIGFKADLILGGFFLLGIELLFIKKYEMHIIVWPVLRLIVFAVIGLLAFLIWPHFLTIPIESTFEFAENWNDAWGIDFSLLTNPMHLGRIAQSLGLGTWAIGIYAMFSLGKDINTRPIFLLCSTLLIPLMLFWVLREGGARHYVIPGIGLIVAICIFLETKKTVVLLTTLMALVLIANHLVFRPSDDSFRPSGRLFESSKLMKNESEFRSGIYGQMKSDKWLTIANAGEFNPYILWAFLSLETGFDMEKRTLTYNLDGRMRNFNAHGAAKSEKNMIVIYTRDNVWNSSKEQWGHSAQLIDQEDIYNLRHLQPNEDH